MSRFSDPAKAINYLIKHGTGTQEIADAVPCGRTTIWRAQLHHCDPRENIRLRLQQLAETKAKKIQRRSLRAANR